MSFLTKEQILANKVARENGFEPYNTVPICSYSEKYKTDVVGVLALQGDERYCLRVSTKLLKVLSNDLLHITFALKEPFNVISIKKFSRPVKKK